MPAKCLEGATRDATYKLLPELIEVREELNGRHDKPDIEWLIADILQHGQIQNVGIWDDGGEPVLAYGFSRWRAISEINKRKLYAKEPLQLKCTFIKTNEKGAFIRNISENRQRNPTTATDDAHNISRLIEAHQLSLEEVAKVYFPTAKTEGEIKDAVKWVSSRLELVKLTPEAQKALNDGVIDETAAQAIAKLKTAQQRELLKKGGKVTAKDANAVRTAGKPAKTPKPKPIEQELKRRITAVLESADFSKFDENASKFIKVDAESLVALKNYVLPE